MTRNQRTQESKYCFSHLRLNGEGSHINLGSVHTHSYDLTVSVAWVGSILPLLRSHQAQLGYRLIWESELPGLALGSSLQLGIWGSCFHPGSSSRPHSAPAQGCLSGVAFSRAGQLEFEVIRGNFWFCSEGVWIYTKHSRRTLCHCSPRHYPKQRWLSVNTPAVGNTMTSHGWDRLRN